MSRNYFHSQKNRQWNRITRLVKIIFFCIQRHIVIIVKITVSKRILSSYLKVSLKSCPTSCWCTTPTPTAGWQRGPLPTYFRLRMPKRFSKRGLINDQGPAFWCSSWLQTYSEIRKKIEKKIENVEIHHRIFSNKNRPSCNMICVFLVPMMNKSWMTFAFFICFWNWKS